MSEFEFGCPKCNERLVAPEKLRGQSVNCPQCGCELIAEEDIDYDKTQTHQAENKSSAAKEALDFSEENKNHQDKQEEKTSGHHESSMESPSSFPASSSNKTSVESENNNIINLLIALTASVLFIVALNMIGPGIRAFEEYKERCTKEKNYAVCGESLQEFIRVASEFEARLDSGMSYRDFENQLVKVDAAWKYFKSLNTDSKLNNEGIDNAIKNWNCAKKVWGIGISRTGTKVDYIKASDLTNSELKLYTGNVGKIEDQIHYMIGVRKLLNWGIMLYAFQKKNFTDYIKECKQ